MAKKAAAKATGTADQIIAYCMSTKQKEVMDNPVISKTSKGQYIAKGTATKLKHKVSVIMSKDSAEAAVKAKIAKKDW